MKISTWQPRTLKSENRFRVKKTLSHCQIPKKPQGFSECTLELFARKHGEDQFPLSRLENVGAFVPPCWIVGSASSPADRRHREEQKHLDRNESPIYSDGVRRHRLSKGETLFRRTRYQHGSVEREERKKGPAVWVYRWWEEDINGKLVHRKAQVGDLKKYPTESAAHSAADALRLTINNRCEHRTLRRTTINTLWEHYFQEELPLKALSTQDAYIIYAKNWIVPR